MQIQANHPDARNNSGLQLSSSENTALQPSRKPIDRQVISTSAAGKSLSKASSTYSALRTQSGDPYYQAVLAYQEAARFEEGNLVPFTFKGNLLGVAARGSETALKDVLLEEPTNTAALYDLGLLYSSQGRRDKVSAVFHFLQTLDTPRSQEFSTQLGLHEKRLLSVA